MGDAYEDLLDPNVPAFGRELDWVDLAGGRLERSDWLPSR